MKKAFVAILAVLYLAVASGVQMNIHYCMGEIASVEYGSSKKDLCGKCGMESKKGCCEDETAVLKIDDSHQLSQLSWSLPAIASLALPVTHRVISSESASHFLYSQPFNGPPPGLPGPLYITHCVFRI